MRPEYDLWPGRNQNDTCQKEKIDRPSSSIFILELYSEDHVEISWNDLLFEFFFSSHLINLNKTSIALSRPNVTIWL